MAALDITWKDLKLLKRDLRAWALLLALPLMFITVIGMAAGQFLTKDENQRKVKLAVFDESQSEDSQALINSLKRHEGVLVLEQETLAAGRQALEKGEAETLLKIAKNYQDLVFDLHLLDMMDSENSDRLKDGPKSLGLTFESRTAGDDEGLVPWLVYFDAYRTILPEVASSNPWFRNQVRRRDGNETESETPPGDEAAGADGATVEDEAAETAQIPVTKVPEPDDTSRVAQGKRDDKIFLILVPGFTVMFVFFLINIMARSFIAERDQGTLRRLRLAPVGAASILIGKTLPFYLTSVVQTSMLFFCGRMLFNMSWGPEPAYLIPVILCTSLAATMLGLLLATLVKTDQQVSAYGTSLVLVLGGISGCLFPRVWLPASMKQISLATPHAWALEAFDAILTRSQVDGDLVLHCCAILLAFAAAFFFCGWLRFRTAT